MEWTANVTTLAALVDQKTTLDADLATLRPADGVSARAAAFDRAVARLTPSARYEFMLACMLRGALADE